MPAAGGILRRMAQGRRELAVRINRVIDGAQQPAAVRTADHGGPEGPELRLRCVVDRRRPHTAACLAGPWIPG